MGIQRFYQFPEGSGSLSGDDVFLFMDNPSSSGVTKKIALSDLIDAIGAVAISGEFNTGDITFDGSTISTANGGIWITNGDDTGFRVPPPTGSSGPFSYDTIITNNDKDWNFTPSGDLILPVSGDIKDSYGNSVLGGAPFSVTTVDLHNGGIQNAQVLQFTDSDYQSVITGPTPASGINAQRIVIQGQRAQGNAEGGDVYLWGGDANANGGDIKIYAGDADNISPDNGYGGYVNIDGGKGATNGGNVEITAGYSEGGTAGYVSIVGGPTSSGSPGDVTIKTNNSTKTWTFGTDGNLNAPGNITLPNYTTVATGTFDNGTGGNNGISLNCYVGYELNWQGGHLKSTQDGGVSAANIYCDSPIEFPGSGIYNLQINSSGIIFPDGTAQNSANQNTTFNHSILSLGTLSGSNAIDFNSDRLFQTLTLNGTSVTLTKGSGWPSGNETADIILRITVSSNTAITWSIVTDWFNQPAAGALSTGTHLFLLRAMGSSIIEGHYIGNKTN